MLLFLFTTSTFLTFTNLFAIFCWLCLPLHTFYIVVLSFLSFIRSLRECECVQLHFYFIILIVIPFCFFLFTYFSIDGKTFLVTQQHSQYNKTRSRKKERREKTLNNRSIENQYIVQQFMIMCPFITKRLSNVYSLCVCRVEQKNSDGDTFVLFHILFSLKNFAAIIE